jgi:hypothetical protein
MGGGTSGASDGSGIGMAIKASVAKGMCVAPYLLKRRRMPVSDNTRRQ